MFLDFIYLWKAGEASFSILINSGLSPLLSRCSLKSVKTRMKSLSACDLIGRRSIKLLP